MAPVLDWLQGDEQWARAVMAFGLFLGINAILIPFGLLSAKIGLPFGISVEGSSRPSDVDSAVRDELTELRKGTERAFERIGESNRLISDTLDRLLELEADVRSLKETIIVTQTDPDPQDVQYPGRTPEREQ
jgi:hypothetical protein